MKDKATKNNENNPVGNKKISYQDVRNNNEIRTYIDSSDKILGIAGYTKHDVGHVSKVAETAAIF